MTTSIRVGISGTGFIARGIASLVALDTNRFRLSGLLTRRDPASVDGFDRDLLTSDMEHLIAASDVIVECSGFVTPAYLMVEAALEAGVPVVTMNAELQATLGPLLSGRGWISEAQGDQPGSQAVLDRDIRRMGFTPLVYGSRKGFLNLLPNPEEMALWARRQGQRVPSVVSFTDGTKVHLEQVLVANALGAQIAPGGIRGREAVSLEEGAYALAAIAERLGTPISDFVLSPGGRGEVFIVATHEDRHLEALRYYKLGGGPHYLFTRPFHLGHFEVFSTLEKAIEGAAPLLVPSRQAFSVAAVAKPDLFPGDNILRGIGSLQVRGEAVPATEPHVPIGLVEGCTITRPVAPGRRLEWDDIELADHTGYDLWQRLLLECSPV